MTTITILRFYSTRGQQDASIVAARDANEAVGPHKRWQKPHKARGVKFGRPPSLTPTSAKKPSSGLRKALQALGANLTYGVSQATISRLQPTPFADARVGAG